MARRLLPLSGAVSVALFVVALPVLGGTGGSARPHFTGVGRRLVPASSLCIWVMFGVMK